MGLETFFALSGILASVWIIFGVWYAGTQYEGYSHSRQFCSELGAAGAPTEKLSPKINNYPLGLLFVLYGVYLVVHDVDLLLFDLMGLLVVAHGIGTWLAGYFPMDADPYTKTPTQSCQIHSWAGAVMYLTLLIAPFLSLFITEMSLLYKVFTAVCIVLSLFFTAKLTKAYKEKTNFGTQQRLSYGMQLVWLSGLSWATL